LDERTEHVGVAASIAIIVAANATTLNNATRGFATQTYTSLGRLAHSCAWRWREKGVSQDTHRGLQPPRGTPTVEVPLGVRTLSLCIRGSVLVAAETPFAFPAQRCTARHQREGAARVFSNKRLPAVATLANFAAWA